MFGCGRLGSSEAGFAYTKIAKRADQQAKTRHGRKHHADEFLAPRQQCVSRIHCDCRDFSEYRRYHSGLYALDLLGTLLFFGSEYGFHHFTFHAPPATRFPWRLKLQHQLHYDHHLEPTRLDLLFLPFWFMLPNFILPALIVYLIWPHFSAVAALLAGMSAAILCYAWVHSVAHIPYRALTPWGRGIKKYHLWHRFKTKACGVAPRIPS